MITQALLSMIGHQREDAAIQGAIRLLSSNELNSRLRLEFIKAFATGLRRGGSSIAKVDAEGKLAAVFTQAASLAQGTTTEAAKVEAIELLSLATKEQGEAALMACLGADQSERVQAAAVKALSELAGKAATTSLLSAWKGFKPQARTVTLATLLSRDDGALALLEAMGSGPVPADLAASQVQDLIKHKNAKVAALAKTALKSVIPPSREEVAKTFAPSVGMKGDSKAGQNHYISRCMACHQANGMGIEVGPNFTTVKTKGRDALLTAILEPHKEVASQYIAYTVNTKDGQTVQGVITADDASSMSLKMMGGAAVTLQRANIKGSSSTGQSLMPEGLEGGLSVQDMADLLSFIEAAN
jgi:putative heme-binding domain-containing protein